jgi:hypothetical protein
MVYMKNRLSALLSALMPRLAVFPALACLLGGAWLTGCLQDPGQTGLGYLNQQGVKLSAPLYHFSFENLPVDSTFATEVPIDHFGDSQVVVGRQNRFVATVRLGFTLTTALQHRHLDSGDGVSLRLVPLRKHNLIGKEFLTASSQNRKTLTLLVESFSWVDIGGNFQDTLNLYDSRILRQRASFASLAASHRRLDTIQISPDSSYFPDSANQDSSQIRALPNLRERLRSVGDSTSKWAVFLQISPLAGATDSGMFRFSSLTTGKTAAIRTYGSGLWLGRYKEESLTVVGALLPPYRLSGTGNPGSTYEIKYTGPSSQSLLFGVTRGVHLRLNRDSLLARIQTALSATPYSALFRNTPAGKFDRRFFVPYAELRLRLSDSLNHVDGPFAFDLSVVSDVDSVGDGETLANFPVALGASKSLSVFGGADYTSGTRDSLRVAYLMHPLDSTLRLITLAWAQDAGTVDTLTMTPNGNHREVVARKHSGWLRQANLSLVPSPSELLIGVHFSAQSFNEPNFIRDSTGLRNVSTNSGLKRRFLRPGADSLAVRVTMGIGQLLNRTSAASITPDIYLRGVDRPAYDTATVNGNTYNRVNFPVMGEVGLPRGTDGKLKAGLDIYLYPLEGGQ